MHAPATSPEAVDGAPDTPTGAGRAGGTNAIDRRSALGAAAAAIALGRVPPLDTSASPAPLPGGMTPMHVPKVTCFIRYQIDPNQLDAFRTYAEGWARLIPRCGGHLVGYFLPNEGTNDIAWG